MSIEEPKTAGGKMYETLGLATDADGILVITLNRPDRLNAFTSRMCDELIDVVENAGSDESVRAIIVTGSGRAFCAGMDLAGEGNVFGLDETLELTLAELEERMDDPAIVRGVRDTGGRVTLVLHRCRKPVIAAINGVAVGIGATMTLAMDFRLAAQDARIGFVFGRIGIVPEACSTWFLPRLVGLQRALEWVYRAESFSAEEGLAAGLLHSLHPADDLLAAAHRLGRQCTAGRSAAAVALTRQMMRQNHGAATPLLAHQTESLAVHWLAQRDGREGVAAFREKRLPKFTNGAQDLPPDFPLWWAD